MPKTGERRKTHRPFAIDKLPAEWGERIIALRAKWMPWERIEEETSRWEWDKLQAEQRQLYPKRRIPMRTLALLERLQYDVHVNLVREILQDLEERRFVSFCSEKDRMTGTVSIRRIQITPGGRDVIEGTASDPAVEVD